LSAQGHVTRFAFAGEILNLLREMAVPGPWARLNPISTTQYPLPATRPLNAATSKARLEHTFGIASPPWQEQLRAYLLDSSVVRRLHEK
jgi:dTDP-4-dehydrorhamnose reductase